MQGDPNSRTFTSEEDEKLIWNMLQRVEVKLIAHEVLRRQSDVKVRMRELRGLCISAVDINTQYQKLKRERLWGPLAAEIHKNQTLWRKVESSMAYIYQKEAVFRHARYRRYAGAMWKEIACRLNLDPSKWVLLEQQQWPQLLLQLGATQQEEIEWEFELSNRVFFQSRFLFPNLLIASRQAQYHQFKIDWLLSPLASHFGINDNALNILENCILHLEKEKLFKNALYRRYAIPMWTEIANCEQLLYPLAWVQIEECVWNTLPRIDSKESGFARAAVKEITSKIRVLF